MQGTVAGLTPVLVTAVVFGFTLFIVLAVLYASHRAWRWRGELRGRQRTTAVKTSSMRYGRRQPVEGSSWRRLSVQMGWEVPP